MNLFFKNLIHETICLSDVFSNEGGVPVSKEALRTASYTSPGIVALTTYVLLQLAKSHLLSNDYIKRNLILKSKLLST